jgi:hypothetical protein
LEDGSMTNRKVLQSSIRSRLQDGREARPAMIDYRDCEALGGTVAHSVVPQVTPGK